MSNENDLNGKVGLDTTDFKAKVADLNRQIRVIESGFKAVAAGMDDWRTTSDGLQGRIESLNKVVDLQKQKLSNLKAEYDKIVASKGADSKAAQDLEVRINKETASLNKNELELRNSQKALEELKNKSDNAEKSIKNLGDEEDKTAKKSASLRDSLKNLGNHLGSGIAGAAKVTADAVVGLGTAAAGAAVGVFKLSESASDLGEAQNVVEQTFKKSNKAIEQWTNTTANSAGISKTASTQWVGFMGAMLKSSGITENSAAIMSKALIQLTGDMSSFYNVGTSDMWEKIRSGISGETEPLKQLGINMSVANLEAFAMSQGIKKSYKEMSQAEQTTLRYNYLLSVTKDAQGDFARTLGNSFANQLRVAKMNLETLGMSIGSIFLPSIMNMTKGLNQVFGEINNVLGDGFQNGDLSKISSIITGVLQKVVQGITSFVPKAVPLIVSSLNTLISSIVQVLPSLLPPLLQGAIQLLNGFIQILQQNTQLISNLATNLLMQFVQFILQGLPQLIMVAIPLLTALVNGISAQLPTLIPVAIQAIFTLVQGLISNLPQLIDAAITLILALVQGLISALPMLLEQAPTIIATLVNGIVTALPKLIDAAIKIIMAIVNFLTQHLDLVIKAAVEIVLAIAGGLIKALPELFKAGPKLINAIIDSIIHTDWGGIGWQIVKGIGEGMTGGVKYIADAAKNVASGALDSIKNFLGIHSPSRVMRDQVGQFIPAGIALGINDNANQVDRAMASMSNKLNGNFTASMQVSNNATEKSNGAILDALNGMAEAIKNYAPKLYMDSQLVAVATGPYDDQILGQYNKSGLRGGGL